MDAQSEPNKALIKALVDGGYNRKWDVERILAAGGVNLNPLPYSPSSPLYVACCRGSGDEATVEVLIQAGAEVNPFRDQYMPSPLMLAAASDHGLIMQVLLKYGADINARDSSGGTVLHQVVMAGHVDCLATLFGPLAESLDVNALDNEGHTALQLAIQLKADSWRGSRNGHEDDIVHDLQSYLSERPGFAVRPESPTLSGTEYLRTLPVLTGELPLADQVAYLTQALRDMTAERDFLLRRVAILEQQVGGTIGDPGSAPPTPTDPYTPAIIDLPDSPLASMPAAPPVLQPVLPAMQPAAPFGRVFGPSSPLPGTPAGMPIQGPISPMSPPPVFGPSGIPTFGEPIPVPSPPQNISTLIVSVPQPPPPAAHPPPVTRNPTAEELRAKTVMPGNAPVVPREFTEADVEMVCFDTGVLWDDAVALLRLYQGNVQEAIFGGQDPEVTVYMHLFRAQRADQTEFAKLETRAVEELAVLVVEQARNQGVELSYRQGRALLVKHGGDVVTSILDADNPETLRTLFYYYDTPPHLLEDNNFDAVD